jgi:hypothetical protein
MARGSLGALAGAVRREELSALSVRVGDKTYVTTLGASTPQAVAQASEWRFMVRALYVAAGSPAVPGFTESQVDQVLWGELPADPEFFAALLRMLSAPRRTSQGSEQTSLLELVSHGRVQDPGAESDYEAQLDKAVDEQLDKAVDDLSQRVLNLFSSTATVSGQRRVVPNAPRARGFVIADPAPRGFAPPDPEGFGTVAEYLQGLRDLKTWARRSMRDIEERTVELANDGEPVIWLPRATVSDILRREKLPKRDAVRAFVMACGLTNPVQARWLLSYDRIRSGIPLLGARNAVPEAA